MKKLCFAAALAVGMSASAALIQWGSSTAFMFDADGSTAVAVGQVVELVYVGDDGIGGAIADVVVDTSTVGSGVGKGTTPGVISVSSNYANPGDYTAGDEFVIRFYSGTAMGYAGADLAGGDTVADARIFTLSAADDGGTDIFTGTAGEMFGTAVPEPGTIMLGLAGLGALVARRRKNRK
jgi:hypothetical protein